MKKKAFTLVELLGVIVILGIIFSLAVVAHLNLGNDINTTYYKTVEESLLIPGGDYFNYNKGEQPGIFGDQKRVKISDLKAEGYLETNVVDSKGNETCDLEKSYVGAYKNSADKTNYYVCLVCNEYETNSLPCQGVVDYSLGVKANKKQSKNTYKLNGTEWSKEDIVLTFETLNDMKQVILESEDGKNVGKCDLKEKKGIKSCTIDVTTRGKYKAYAINDKASTRKKDLEILIDKTLPTMVVENGNDVIAIEVKNGTSTTIKNKVSKIEDLESDIKSIEYSFEKEGNKDYYHEVKEREFEINETLELGVYYFKIRVENNASGVLTKTIKYQIYKSIDIPTSSEYCNNLTYNGNSQTLVKSAGEGFTFSSTTGTYAGNYDIKVKLKPNYQFKDGTTADKTITCSISKKSITITADSQAITYGDSIYRSPSYVTVRTLASGDSLNSISLSQSTSNVPGGTISASGAVIKKGSTVVTSSYSITYYSGNLTIYKAATATTGSCDSPSYTGYSQTLASGGYYVYYSGNYGTNAGSYNVTVSTDSNHTFRDGSTTKTLYCSVERARSASEGQCDSPTYTGSSLTLASGSAHASYSNNTRTESGSQNVTVTADSNYAFSDGTTTKTLSCSVQKAKTATTGSCNKLTYNGSNQTLVSGGKFVSYTGNSVTNAGTHNVTITADSNHSFEDGETTKTLTCNIKKLATATTGSCNILTYNGSKQTLVSGGNYVTYSNNSQAIAGSYKVTVTSNDNYTFADGLTTKTLSCSIKRSPTAAAGSCNSPQYNGGKQALASGGRYVTYSNNYETNFGSYEVTAVADRNHTFRNGATSQTLNCRIYKSPTANPGYCYDATYTGFTQTLAGGGSNVSYTDNLASSIGQYTVTVTANYNYSFSDGTTTKYLNCSISNPTPPSISFSLSGSRPTSNKTDCETGYKIGATVTVTCSDDYGISSFTVSGTRVNRGSVTNISATPTGSSTSKSATISMPERGTYTISATCTSIHGQTSTTSQSYDICTSYDCSTYKTTYSGKCSCNSQSTGSPQGEYSCSSSATSCSDVCANVNGLPTSGRCTSSQKLVESKECWTL